MVYLSGAGFYPGCPEKVAVKWMPVVHSKEFCRAFSIRQSYMHESTVELFTRAQQLLRWATVPKQSTPKSVGEGCCVPPFHGGAGSPSNTMSPGPRPTSVPCGILIHPFGHNTPTLPWSNSIGQSITCNSRPKTWSMALCLWNPALSMAVYRQKDRAQRRCRSAASARRPRRRRRSRQSCHAARCSSVATRATSTMPRTPASHCCSQSAVKRDE